MKKRYVKIFWYWGVVLSWIIFSYAADIGLYMPFLGFLTILIITKFSGLSLRNLGIPCEMRPYLIFFISLPFLIGGSYLFLDYIFSSNSGKIVPFIKLPGLSKWYLFSFFQTLNEEVVLGYFTLDGIKNIFPKMALWMTSLIVAFLFAMVHYIFYYLALKNSIGLDIYYMFICFIAVAVIRNFFIIYSGHILYAWCLHLAWNVNFFCSKCFIGEKELLEYERFLVVFTNKIFIAGLILICSLLFVYHLKRPKVLTDGRFYE